MTGAKREAEVAQGNERVRGWEMCGAQGTETEQKETSLPQSISHPKSTCPRPPVLHFRSKGQEAENGAQPPGAAFYDLHARRLEEPPTCQQPESVSCLYPTRLRP